ncbi:rab effector MyRIP [Trichomycterus rosablanca]|uniref:rab effector MyRIP n=1 Tax=Trichomycterus rosablanca TaxID=2290929 RepID=UPI002F352196
MMGRKLDVSKLTEEEAEHVLQVVQRDMQLRKSEEERLSELKQKLDQEESRCVLLSRQRGFNERCCIRCCSSFTFLLKPRRRCLDCCYNVCKRCCSYSEPDKSWICFACEKSRLLKTQSLEWFYNNVRRRFKRFGSAKVLKMLYRRHIGEQESQAELTEGSTYAESVSPEDSVYESDSTFYKHSEERSMAESISVALRVAKEAIDEAITKAESQPENQKKLNEACYLRDNRGELIEELTTLIVQTIICRKRDLSEMQPKCNLESPPDQNSNKPHSALSILTEEMLAQQDKAEQSPMLCTQGPVPTVPGRSKSVDWMENSCTSSVLQSPDGNWFALQSAQPSRLSLPNNRENLMFSALEKESSVISAYDGMASDAESDTEATWTAAWLEYHCKMSSNTAFENHEPAGKNVADQTRNDPAAEIHKANPLLKRKVLQEHRRSYSQCPNTTDTNINLDGTDSSEDAVQDNRVKRTRRRNLSKREYAEGNVSRESAGEETSLSEPQVYGRMLLDILLKCQSRRQAVSEFLSTNAYTPESLTPDVLKSGTITPGSPTPDVVDTDPNIETHVLTGSSDDQLEYKLRDLASSISNELDADWMETSDCECSAEMEINNPEIVQPREETPENPEPVEEDEIKSDGGDITSEDMESVSLENSYKMNHLQDIDVQERTVKSNDGETERSVGIPQQDDCEQSEEQVRERNSIQYEEQKTPEESGNTQNVDRQEYEVEDLKPESRDHLENELAIAKEERVDVYNHNLLQNGNEEYERMIGIVVKALDDMENEIDAHLSDARSETSDVANEKKCETVEEQTDKTNTTQNNQMDHAERTTEDKQALQDGVVDEESTEEQICEVKEQCNDHVIREDVEVALSGQNEFLSPEEIYKKYSAASLRSITTEVLKVLNATEDLIQSSMDLGESEYQDQPALPPAQRKRLDEQLIRLEENVYVAASAVFGLEAELGDLEECARSISGETTEGELVHLEEQVASAAAQVQQSELQVTDIAARIAALKNAGLNVAPQTRFAKSQTIETSRQQRRRLPVPPVKGV